MHNLSMSFWRRYATVWALPALALIGWFDYLTGPAIGFSLFYLAVILAVAWLSGRTQAISAAVAAALCWLAAEMAWRQEAPVVAWNGFTRLVIYVLIADLVHRLHTERHALEQVNAQMRRSLERESLLARTDSLTELPNLRAFLEHLRRESARARREGRGVCLLFLDLDNFKAVNDLYGHAQGDTVLQQVGSVISSAIRGGDMAARIGGDEFVIALWRTARADAPIVADRLVRQVEMIAANYPAADLSVSAGISFFEQPPEDPEELLKSADRAMYAVKEQRKQPSDG